LVSLIRPIPMTSVHRARTEGAPAVGNMGPAPLGCAH
jgi:hypothetical protein